MRRAHGAGVGLDERPAPEADAVAVSTRPEPLRTEFPFELPRGYVDGSGNVHRSGIMRLATGRDELVPLRDDRVRENPAYLSVVLLARVVTRLGRRGRRARGRSAWRSCRTSTAG